MTPQGKGAKEKLLTRIIVSRCEVDLKKVCSEYKAHFGESLQKAITVNNKLGCFFAFWVDWLQSTLLSALFLQEHTKGDYQKVVLSLCGPEE